MKVIAMVLGAFFAVQSVATAANTAANENAAVASARTWLGKIDAEKYAESWDDAAAPFKNAISRSQWSGSLEAVRKPLGKSKSRKLLSKKYTESLPGVPEGKYVVIQFETEFENKKAVETMTPMLDKDGKWHVSGYFIK